MVIEAGLVVLEFDKISEEKPTLIDTFKNCEGQEVSLYEDPQLGDEGTILGVIEKVMFDTSFFDVECISEEDYQPILMADGQVLMQFETTKTMKVKR